MDTYHSLNSFLHKQCQRLNASACESVEGDITSYASLTVSMSTLNLRYNIFISKVCWWRDILILVRKPMLYYANLMLVLFCPYFIQSHKPQLSQSRGKIIILSHKSALSANNLTDHQVCIMKFFTACRPKRWYRHSVINTAEYFSLWCKVLYLKLFFCMFASFFSFTFQLRASSIPNQLTEAYLHHNYSENCPL